MTTRAPDNEAMVQRLAGAVGELPTADAAMVAAGLFAIAASIDRFTALMREEVLDGRRCREAAGNEATL